MQYAGLLQQANRLDQAGGLFRQVLASDPSNTQAWEGLIRVEHAMKQDAQAIQTLESMPPTSYDVAMRDPGFESTVASVYQTQNKLDIAQSILEKAIAQQTTTGQKPSIGTETQLAGIYLAQNNGAAGVSALPSDFDRKSRTHRRLEGPAIDAAQFGARPGGIG